MKEYLVQQWCVSLYVRKDITVPQCCVRLYVRKDILCSSDVRVDGKIPHCTSGVCI